MHNYEFMNTLVADRRASLESDAATWRMAQRRSARSWFRRASKAGETDRRETTLVTLAVPTAGTSEFQAWASALGAELARGVEGHLRALARRARELHVAVVPASVLADRHAPEVVRARAFSRVVVALGTLTSAGTIAVDAAA
jgi:GTP-sensing pleiotropic transcriptional regulator CodY